MATGSKNQIQITFIIKYFNELIVQHDADILSIFNNSVIHNFLLLYDINVLYDYYNYLIELKYTDKTLEIHKRNIIITKLKELLTTNNDNIVSIFNLDPPKPFTCERV
jgi:hypothetical protein